MTTSHTLSSSGFMRSAGIGGGTDLAGLTTSHTLSSSGFMRSAGIGGGTDLAGLTTSHKHTNSCKIGQYCNDNNIQQELSHDSIARLNCALPITKTIMVIW